MIFEDYWDGYIPFYSRPKTIRDIDFSVMRIFWICKRRAEKSSKVSSVSHMNFSAKIKCLNIDDQGPKIADEEKLASKSQ